MHIVFLYFHIIFCKNAFKFAFASIFEPFFKANGLGNRGKAKTSDMVTPNKKIL